MALSESGSIPVRIHSYQTDGTGKCRTSYILRFFEQGRVDLLSKEQIQLVDGEHRFVVRGQLVKVEKSPHFGQRCRVETWMCAQTDKTFTFAQVLYGDDGDVLAHNRCTLTRVSLVRKRAVPISEDTAKLLGGVIAKFASKYIPPPPELPAVKPVGERPARGFEFKSTVLASHIDSFGHVNHARYADYAFDALIVGACMGQFGAAAAPLLNGSQVIAISMSHSQETVLNDALSVIVWPLSSTLAQFQFGYDIRKLAADGVVSLCSGCMQLEGDAHSRL